MSRTKSLSPEQIGELLRNKPEIKKAWHKYLNTKDKTSKTTIESLKKTLGIEIRGQYKLFKNAELVVDMKEKKFYRLNIAQTTKTLICFDDGNNKPWEDDLLEDGSPPPLSQGVYKPPPPPKGKLGCEARKRLCGANG